METAKKITGEMLVGKICAEYPEAIPALQSGLPLFPDGISE